MFFLKDDLIPKGLNLPTGFGQWAGSIHSGPEWKQPGKFPNLPTRLLFDTE
jgi:hypothetical protein